MDPCIDCPPDESEVIKDAEKSNYRAFESEEVLRGLWDRDKRDRNADKGGDDRRRQSTESQSCRS